MKNNLFTSAIVAFALCYALPGHAVNLVGAYRDALRSDPTFKAAEAQNLATAQASPIVQGALFPQVAASGFVDRLHDDQDFANIHTVFDQTIQYYTLEANQVIFNYGIWSRLQNARAQVKAAQATYNAAQQDLMMRLSAAYFAVLNAHDTLLATQGEKESLAEQLRQTQEQFNVGLIAKTGVDQVTASYDITLAQEIAQKNAISDRLEELRAITGVFYKKLAGVKGSLPLILPEPNNINAWVRVTEQQNYTLLASKFAMQAAKENINIQRAGHYPVVGATGALSYSEQDPIQFLVQPGTNLRPKLIDRVASVGVNAQLPISTGGTVTAQVRQASYQYAQAAAQMDFTYRGVLKSAREAFLGVTTGVSKIKADKQAVMSNQSSLEAIKAGYLVGTNTLLDVLQQQSALYTAQTSFTSDQYAYLINTLNLKQAAGTLCEQDLGLINTWLNEAIDFSSYYFDDKGPS